MYYYRLNYNIANIVNNCHPLVYVTINSASLFRFFEIILTILLRISNTQLTLVTPQT